MYVCPSLRAPLRLAILSGLAGAALAVLAGCAGPPSVPLREDPLPVAVTRATVTGPDTVLPETGSAEEGFLIAREAFLSGDLETAQQYARSVVGHYPGTAWQKRALFLQGRILLSRGTTTEAERVLGRIPTEFPVLADYALFLVAEQYAALRRYDDAAIRYQRLVDNYPASSLVPRALLRKGQVLFDAGRAEDAAAVFERILNDAPWADEAPAAAVGLARARSAGGDTAGAVRALQIVRIRYPASGGCSEAEQIIASLAASGAVIPPLTADEQYERARNLYRAGRFDGAADAYGRVLDADPAYPQRAEVLLRTGIALYNSGKRPEAASILEKLLKARLPDCRCTEALLWLGKSYSRLGLREDAVDAFRRLVRSYPDSELADDALYLAGNVYRDAGDMRQALRYYRRLVDDYPESSFADSALWWESWEYYSTERYTRAIHTLQEIVRRYPRSFLVNQALYWQGRAAEQSGDRDHAANYYERLLRRGPYSYYGHRAEERLDRMHVPDPVIVPAADDYSDTADNEADEGSEEGMEAEAMADMPEPGEPPDWADDVIASLSATPAYRKTLELMQLGMQAEAAAELAEIQDLLPRRSGALMGLSKAFFELGDYHRSLTIVLRNFERILERPSARFSDDLWLLAYPQGYWMSITESARKYGVDPFLVAAIIRQESQFHTDAVSPAGARGVMQIMPRTGAWIARSAGISGYDRTRLLDANTNIDLGTWYLSFLMRRFQGRLALVSAAYNAGPDAVRSWLDGTGTTVDPALFVESIPYAETRGYVKKVLRNYAEYRRLYGRTGETSAGMQSPLPAAGGKKVSLPETRICKAGNSCP